MRPDSPTGLYWSNRGSVLCRDHAFELSDAEWDDDRWQPMPPSSQGFRGVRYQCQVCAHDRAAIIHPPSHHAFSRK